MLLPAWFEHAASTLPRVCSTAGAMAVCLLIYLPRTRPYAAAMLRRRASIVEYVGQNAGLCFSVFEVAGLNDRLLRRHWRRHQRPSCDNRVTHAAVDPEHRHAVQHYADQPCGADKP